MKLSEAIGLVADLKAAFPRHPISEETLKLYCNFMADMDITEAKKATYVLISEGTFFPSIAELRRAAMTVQPDASPIAAEAWEIVYRGIRQGGFYNRPRFASPVIDRVVDAIGWQNLCHSENIAIERAQFLKIYENINTAQMARENRASLSAGPMGSVMDALGEVKRLGERRGD